MTGQAGRWRGGRGWCSRSWSLSYNIDTVHCTGGEGGGGGVAGAAWSLSYNTDTVQYTVQGERGEKVV